MRYKASTLRIIEKLKELYPEGLCSLQYEKDYELLFAVRLSAQCTDARVNLVTPALFARFPTLEAFAAADPREGVVDWCLYLKPVLEIIDGTFGQQGLGPIFGETKQMDLIVGSKDLVACAQQLLERFDGKVPDNMEDLTSLPGVGRKTANLILGDVYGQPSYVCDTHCIRITGRLGITDGSKDPVKVEQQLRKAIPPAESGPFCHRMVLFGRDVCTARSPKCEDCPLKADCAQGKKLK